jgi:hypothetical protein
MSNAAPHLSRLVGIAVLLLLPRSGHAGGLTGPVLDDGRAVVIEDVVQLPFSSASPPHARLNVLSEAPDGSGRLFVNDLNGPLHIIDGASVHTYLDLRTLRPQLKTSTGLGTGFVSFAFHPDFATNGLFYTAHSETITPPPTPPPANLEPAVTTTINQHSIVTEWHATIPAANAFVGTSRELIRIAAPLNIHNLGELSFDPTAAPGDADYGLLYIAAGDFGSAEKGEPEQLQRLDTPLGALLRIDPLGGPFERGGVTYDYGIPAGNPFAADGNPSTFDEIFAYGFRNGHRIVWDPASDGAAFITGIGESNIEEINVLAAGANYGWPEREGTFAIDVDVDPTTVFPLPPNDHLFGYRYPAAQYDHSDTTTFWVAIAGGAVLQDAAAPSLDGELIFGDVVDGSLFHVRVADLYSADDGDPATTAQIRRLGVIRNGASDSLLQIVRDALSSTTHPRTDIRFARDLSGKLYLTTKSDAFVRRILPVETAYPNGWSLIGEAIGGFTIDFSVQGVALQIVTTAAQTAAEVAAAMADAVQQHATLQAQSIYAASVDGRFATNGSADSLTIADPGIAEAPTPPPIPALPISALAVTLAGLLAAARTSARRFRVAP